MIRTSRNRGLKMFWGSIDRLVIALLYLLKFFRCSFRVCILYILHLTIVTDNRNWNSCSFLCLTPDHYSCQVESTREVEYHIPLWCNYPTYQCYTLQPLLIHFEENVHSSHHHQSQHCKLYSLRNEDELSFHHEEHEPRNKNSKMLKWRLRSIALNRGRGQRPCVRITSLTLI